MEVVTVGLTSEEIGMLLCGKVIEHDSLGFGANPDVRVEVMCIDYLGEATKVAVVKHHTYRDRYKEI